MFFFKKFFNDKNINFLVKNFSLISQSSALDNYFLATRKQKETVLLKARGLIFM